ncbi:MAG: 4Fe-4S binding protein [Candidatus Hodarchaeales archaeon]
MSAQAVQERQKETITKKNPSGKALIVCDTAKCNACYLCEDICSLVKYNQMRPFLARIKTDKHAVEYPVAMACRQCEDAACIKACPTDADALSMEDVLICDPEKCILCGWCIDACPFGALNSDFDAKKVVACDLCLEDRIDGLAPCVAFCPREALVEESWNTAREKGTEYLRKNLLIVEDEG